MAFLEHIPALLRLLIAFSLVIFCIRKKLSLGNSFLIGSISLGLFFGLSPYEMLKSMGGSVINAKTSLLALIVSLILVLSNCMEKAGQMQRLLESFKDLVSNPKLSIVVFPALIGLLPMPGGAIFSAPMVKELGAQSDYSPDRLSLINYWFRHIWEYWWPLYPSIPLVMILTGINISSFMIFMLPLTFVVILIGYCFLKGSESQPRNNEKREKKSIKKSFLKELLPILIVIIPGLGIGIALSAIFPNLNNATEFSLNLALLAAILWVCISNKISVSTILAMIRNPQMLNMIYMVFSILIFKGMLEGSNAVKEIIQELTYLHIPLFLIITILPFLVGIVTGMTIAFVGGTFPILIPLIHSIDPTGNFLSYVMLAMICGFAGVLMSPVHLCLILSNEYFCTPMGPVYKILWLPCIALIASGYIYFFISV